MADAPKKDMIKTGVVVASIIGIGIYTQYKISSMQKEMNGLKDEIQTMAKYINLLESTLSSRMHANTSQPAPNPNPQPSHQPQHNHHPNPRPSHQPQPRPRPQRGHPRSTVEVIESEEEFSDTDDEGEYGASNIQRPDPPSSNRRSGNRSNPPPRSNRRVDQVNNETNIESDEQLSNPPQSNRRSANRSNPRPKAGESRAKNPPPKVVGFQAADEDGHDALMHLDSISKGDNNLPNSSADDEPNQAERTRLKAAEMKKKQDARLARIKARGK